MSREKLSSLLVREGFSVVGDNVWKIGRVLITLANGFLVVKYGDEGTLRFSFREDDVFDFIVIDGMLVIWYGEIQFTRMI